MFSAVGMAAMTSTFGLSWPMARIAARAAAAPPMSSFIVSIHSGCFSDSPPESNVMPLPVMAMGAPAPAL